MICLSALVALPLHAEVAPGDPLGAFEITRFEVTGNTLLDSSAVQAAVAGFAGKSRDFDSVERAIAALEDAYRRRGFSLVKVMLPEQELNEGVVHLKVLEMRLGKVRVAGNVFHSAANIRRSLPALAEDTIPNADRLSANLRMANENPSKKVNLQLQGSNQPGVIDALVEVADEKTWSAGAVLDNSGVDSTGRTHVTAQYQNFNLGGLDHVLSMQYTTSLDNPSRISVYGAGYHLPLYGEADSVDLYGSYSTIDAGSVSAGLLELSVSGAGTVFGVHFNHDFPRVGRYDSQLVVGFDRKAFRNSVELQGLQLGGDVTVDPLSLSYVGQWALPAGNLNFYLTGVRNVPGGSQAGDANFTAARFGATSSYGLLRYGAGFTRPLPRDWLIRLTFNGQATRAALVPGEQIGVGGAASVRGLHERELANDKGFTANAEVYTPNLCAALRGPVTHCMALAFFDDGHISRNDALPGEETHQSVSSAGAGLRVTRGRTLSLQMDFGRVVSASDPRQKGDQRLHALLALAF
ncbi:MAG: ShlB/FhaC/HecB family hemolysin secretion/activation protein [Gammaproteobacteria bacterium]|nr:ShlB/FhaC/HecB family hemolysin secretion/activation protein [Gammaproteobacteria bacterium]